jgi:hypothetical protein
MENNVVSEVSQDLVVIFKIKQSTVRNILRSDNVTPYKSGIFNTPLLLVKSCGTYIRILGQNHWEQFVASTFFLPQHMTFIYGET